MLRACRRVLKPGGRLAFFTIFAAPGLSEREYRRALRSGANHLSTRHIEHEHLIASAGLTLLEKRDATPEFLRTAQGWYDARMKYEAGVRQSEGDDCFHQRQRDALAQIRAVKDGLIRRALFVATRP